MKKLITFFFFIIFLLSTHYAYAISCNGVICRPGINSCDPVTGGCAAPGGGTVVPAGTVNTALGLIPTDPELLTGWILQKAVIAGGGIAFILSLYGAVSIILAGGDPEKINQGKQIITSAISGLLFIFFSVFLLRFIGYDILKLPDFKP